MLFFLETKVLPFFSWTRRWYHFLLLDWQMVPISLIGQTGRSKHSLFLDMQMVPLLFPGQAGALVLCDNLFFLTKLTLVVCFSIACGVRHVLLTADHVVWVQTPTETGATGGEVRKGHAHSICLREL